MSSCWKKLLISGAVAILFPGVLSAQSTTLGTTFRVVIRDSNQHPKPNVRVTLGKANAYTLRALMRGNTSQDGILSFARVPAGEYTMQLVDAGGENYQFLVQVVAKGGAPEFTYSWPYIHWFPMTYASGVLMDGPTPLNHRNIVLRSFPDERVIASAQTDLQGAFDLPISVPGRYVLDISRIAANGTAEAVGRMYVLVSLQGERRGTEPIFLDRLPRGLEYDRFCSLAPVELNDPCFQTAGPDGNPLSSALLSIRAEAGFTRPQTYTSDSQGMIKFPVLPAGNYLVQVFAKGDTPVRFPLKLKGGTGACTAPFKISFNSIGSGCAPATSGKAN